MMAETNTVILDLERYDKLVLDNYAAKNLQRKQDEFISTLLTVINYVCSPQREYDSDKVIAAIREIAPHLRITVDIEDNKIVIKNAS